MCSELLPSGPYVVRTSVGVLVELMDPLLGHLEVGVLVMH